MEAIILDPIQQSKLASASNDLPVHDQTGHLLGYLLTPEAYSKFLAKTCAIPYTSEQLHQFEQSGGGCSLDEFWKKMDAR